MEIQKWKIGLQVFHSLHHTKLQYMACLESYKIWVFKNMQTIRAGQYYGQFMVIIHAILVYGQFTTFMHPYLTIYDLVFISCFLFCGQPGKLFVLEVDVLLTSGRINSNHACSLKEQNSTQPIYMYLLRFYTHFKLI